MAQTGLTPRGVSFVHEAASKAYEDQMKWIDALDGKAGILMAGDGVIAGLIMTQGSVLTKSPTPIAVIVTVLLFASLGLALLAFGTRRYEVAPDIDQLLPQMPHLDDDALRWIALKGYVNALDVNESKVEQKADLTFYSGMTLLGAIVIFGGYFIYFLV